MDDEPYVLKSLAATLRKHFEVISATSAAEALDLLKREPGLRVVVSDYRMPGMDGGAGAENVVLENAELAFRVLAKPCPRETLILAIEDVLTRWSVGEA